MQIHKHEVLQLGHTLKIAILQHVDFLYTRQVGKSSSQQACTLLPLLAAKGHIWQPEHLHTTETINIAI